jgi:hypothetical protein
MKNILPQEEFLNENYQRKISDRDTTKKLFRFFEQVFYEIGDKRFNEPLPHQLEELTTETKKYLLDVLDVVKEWDRTWPRLGQFLDPQTNEPLTTDDEKISYLASNFFSGFGRPSRLGTSLNPEPGLLLPEPPSQEVVNSIINFAKSR